MRLVKIDLSRGQVEVLVTNLSGDEFSRLEVGELYNLCWRVETAFLGLKYAVRVEEFVSRCEDLILQEFFASLV